MPSRNSCRNSSLHTWRQSVGLLAQTAKRAIALFGNNRFKIRDRTIVRPTHSKILLDFASVVLIYWQLFVKYDAFEYQSNNFEPLK